MCKPSEDPRTIDPAFGNDGVKRYAFFCPGCKSHHAVVVKRPSTGSGAVGPVWNFNLDRINPTVTPSIRVRNWDGQQCHLFVTSGKLRYLADCSHELAGKTVPMIPMEEV